MRQVGLAVLAVGLAGCLLSSEPAGRLDVSLSLSAIEVNEDSGVVIRVTAVNRGPYPLRLETTGGCVVAFRLVGPDGAPFTPSPSYGCAAILRLVDVPAGDSVVGVFPVFPRPYLASGSLVRWRPGSYQAVGQLLDRDAGVIEETAPTEFRLTCRDLAC
jgi:hypothetical protein